MKPAGTRRRGKSGKRRRRSGRARPTPDAALRRGWRTFQRLPLAARLVVGILAALTLSVAVNWLYQVVRKPSELFFPVSGALYKTPTETWRQYAPIFRAHATPVITPDLLAAIAQVEGSGNPVVRTYWRWSWTTRPFAIYRPASSAVGMYQITDGTYAEARRLCIHDHAVVHDGPWHHWQSCWFNGLYARVVPSHAVEMTAAYLDQAIATTLLQRGVPAGTLQQRQDLAAVIHLCGAGAGNVYARRRYRLLPGQRCGDHEVRGYIARIRAMRAVFRELAEARR